MNAKRRRQIHLAIAALWAGPGVIVTVLWPNAVWWVAAMSLWANLYTAISAYSAETPVEREDEDSPSG